MTQHSKPSVIIPAYNEEGAIHVVLDKFGKEGLFDVYDVIIVNDGSTDNTAQIAGNYPVKIITHETNKGYGASLKSGIRKSKGDIILTMDSDGQHDPLHLEQCVKLLNTFDMVIGERDASSHQVGNRKLGKYLIRKTGEYLVEQKLPDFNSGLRGFHRNLIEPVVHLMPNGFSFSTTSTLAFLKEGYSIGTFPIQVEAREGRKSSVNFIKDGSKTMLLLFRIIMLFNPMKVFFPASIFFSLAGIIWGILGFIGFGRFSTSATVFITFGMMLFFFGLIADQIALLNRKK